MDAEYDRASLSPSWTNPKLKRSCGMEAECDRASLLTYVADSKEKMSCIVEPPSSQLQGFKFPVSKSMMDCSKMGMPLQEEDRKQLIRDCVSCLKAVCGDHVSKDQFRVASQMICSKVPVLRDVKPPSWPANEEFHYYVSQVKFFLTEVNSDYVFNWFYNFQNEHEQNQITTNSQNQN